MNTGNDSNTRFLLGVKSNPQMFCNKHSLHFPTKLNLYVGNNSGGFDINSGRRRLDLSGATQRL